MNRPPEPQRDDLLADVLAEAEPADFRAALLGETLRLVRRRRRVRSAVRVAALAAPLVALGLFAWRTAPPRSSETAPPSSSAPIAARPAPHAVVHTYPLSHDAIVHTAPLDPASQIRSFAGVATIRTPDTDLTLRIIGDEELLALAAPRPAALIRFGPDTQELIFADTDGHPDSR